MLHQLLTDLRKASNVSLHDVQDALGVSRATAYAWETPAVKPSPPNLQALLDLYGATDEQRLRAWELRAGVGEAEGTTNDNEEV